MSPFNHSCCFIFTILSSITATCVIQNNKYLQKAFVNFCTHSLLNILDPLPYIINKIYELMLWRNLHKIHKMDNTKATWQPDTINAGWFGTTNSTTGHWMSWISVTQICCISQRFGIDSIWWVNFKQCVYPYFQLQSCGHTTKKIEKI